MIKNPFETLGLPVNATLDECKKAYRQLSRKYHPDCGGDADKFDDINKAWTMIQNGEAQIFVDMGKKKSKLTHSSLFNFDVI